jgi:hypothetical protein
LNKKYIKHLTLISIFIISFLTLFSFEIYSYGNHFKVFGQDTNDEEQIEKILYQAYLSNDFNILVQSINTVASYGTIAIDNLVEFSEKVSDFQLKKYIFSKIEEIKNNTKIEMANK